MGTYLIMPAVNILNVINKWQRVAMWLLAAVTVANLLVVFQHVGAETMCSVL